MDFKKKSFNVPLSPRQREKVGQAAQKESERQGVRIPATVLFRDLAMERVEEILGRD